LLQDAECPGILFQLAVSTRVDLEHLLSFAAIVPVCTTPEQAFEEWNIQRAGSPPSAVMRSDSLDL
jgi:hypothetical protein